MHVTTSPTFFSDSNISDGCRSRTDPHSYFLIYLKLTFTQIVNCINYINCHRSITIARQYGRCRLTEIKYIFIVFKNLQNCCDNISIDSLNYSFDDVRAQFPNTNH